MKRQEKMLEKHSQANSSEPMLPNTNFHVMNGITQVPSNTDLLNRAKDVALSALFQCFPINFYWMDKTGKILGCNENQLKEFGLKTLDEIIGKHSTDFAPIQHWENSQRIMRDKATETVEETVTNREGKSVTYLSIKSPILDEQNNAVGFVGISIDITDRKNAEVALRKAKEAAEAANRAKSVFLENMRYDVRTPLTGIIGFAELLRNEIKEPKIREYAENLVASGKILLDFMNEILETVRVTSGHLPLVQQPFDLRAKVDDIIQLNQAKARAKKLKLVFHFDKRIPHHLVSDPKRVARIVLELVTNALNFTSKGFVSVRVSLAQSEEQKKVIKISVEDTGMGIAPERKDDLFACFQRLTPSYEDLHHGAGLGLYIVKQFLDELGGEIDCQSQPNKGSTFTCLIPFKVPLSPDKEKVKKNGRSSLISDLVSQPTFYENNAEKRGEENIQNSHILVIEDDCLSARAIAETLLKLNCRIDLAFNGEAALKLFKRNHYDLIFMDIGMPRMDGYEVTKRIRALERESDKMTPIIALTSLTESDQKQSCLAVGMNAVLTKPLLPEKAIDILNAFLFNNSVVVRDTSLLMDRSLKPLDRPVSKKQASEVIDIKGTAKRIGLKPEKVIELLHMFIENIDADLDYMAKAYHEKRWKEVAEIAHKLKGGAIYCGAFRLQDACGSLENQLIAGKTEAATLFYEKFLKEVKALKRAFKDYE